MRNWAGNIEYRPSAYVRPTSVEELQEIVASSAKVHVLGSGHSFNRIADTTGVLVSTRGLTDPVRIDASARTATVPSGMRYGEVAAELDAAGWALHSLGSLPHISVAGACATSTHGSGDGNGSLATAVRGVEFVRADGELVRIDSTHSGFGGAVVSLGALGVATRLTLAVQPTFDVRQDVYDDMPLDSAAEHLEEIFAAAYSVSLFSDFTRPDLLNTAWRKSRVDVPGDPPPDSWFGARRAPAPRNPVPGIDPAAATEQLGRPGPWHQRLPHFRLEFTPSTGEELQSEFLVPRRAGAEALLSLRANAARITPALQVFEMRTIAADEMWLSPFFGRDSIGLHFTWRPDDELVRPAVRAVQAAIRGLAVRPHWGKVFFDFGAVDFAAMYPRMADFRRLAAELDPDRHFANDFLERFVLG